MGLNLSMHMHIQTRGAPQENFEILQLLRLFLVASEAASGAKHYHIFQWPLLYSLQ